ncbi:MAG: hypothetical protein GY870_16855, partial [archaeon]|nr:hypothetical protein [archaeon]
MPKKPILLILLKNKDKKKNEDLFIKNSRIIWSGFNGTLTVGMDKQSIWNVGYILKFKNIKTCLNAIEIIKSGEYDIFRIFLVEPYPKLLISLIKFMMKKVFPRKDLD